MARTAAVVGGGIGGLTAAMALLRAGFDVRVYEQATSIAEVGAGIQLAPNATRVLEALGLLPAVAGSRSRRPPSSSGGGTTAGCSRTHRSAMTSRGAYGAPYLHAHRGDLVALLADAVSGDLVEIGRRCVGVTATPAARRSGSPTAAPRSPTSSWARTASTRSSAQSILGPEDARFTGHVAYRGLDSRRAGGRTCRRTRPRRCGWAPARTSCTTSSPPAGCSTSSASSRPTSWTRESWTDRGDVAELHAAFAGWHPVVGGIIDALDRPLKWALFDRLPFPRWSAGAVTLLGDACHPMLPYGAQGAAQAIEDAAVLAACLTADADVPAALDRYERLRRPRTSRVQEISRGNAQRFHLPDGPEQMARDAAMASSYGLSPDIDWLYGYDPLEMTRA